MNQQRWVSNAAVVAVAAAALAAVWAEGGHDGPAAAPDAARLDQRVVQAPPLMATTGSVAPLPRQASTVLGGTTRQGIVGARP